MNQKLHIANCTQFGAARACRFAPRRAFTLVEMLVAVALVVLMMSMFATIFQIATGSMGKQKGIAENDQRARTAVTVIKNDLDKRTFRLLHALSPGLGMTDSDNQRGYFYISENNLADPTDDVLQFTIDITRGQTNSDKTPLYGRATILSTTGATSANYLINNPNQPEFDDGQLIPDSAASSTAAEVSYFLRGNVLYRRIVLIRVPFSGTEDQPMDVNGNLLTGTANPYPQTTVSGATVNLTGPTRYPLGGTVATNTYSFWNDFDFSVVNIGGGAGIQFLGSGALNNNDVSSSFFSLGKPYYRFGHDYITGLPREYVGPATSPQFIGRFTHGETSHQDFNYPPTYYATNTGGVKTNPYAAATITALSQNAMTFAVTQFSDATGYAGGPRIGEDVLLTNVHSFDIKVFDDYTEDVNGNGLLDTGEDSTTTGTVGTLDYVMDFRDIGHSGAVGWYNSTSKLNTTYGGGGGSNNIFDTWHPDSNNDGVANATDPVAPYRPARFGADGMPGIAGVDDNGDGKPDVLTWTDTNMDGIYQTGEPILSYDTREAGAPYSDDLVYPIRAIQIKIRYYDITSAQLRELTIIHSLLE